MTTQLGRPVGASGDETRQRIITATMRCVAEVGYSGASIRQIARAANVTSASLYNYFPTKSELIKATIEARSDYAIPRLRKAAQIDGDVVDRIESVLDESARLIREYPDLAAFEWAIRAESAISIYPEESGRVGLQQLRDIIEGIVDDARRQGTLGDRPDARATVEVIYALIYGLTEVAATASPQTYQRTFKAAKRLLRGTLFDGGGESAGAKRRG